MTLLAVEESRPGRNDGLRQCFKNTIQVANQRPTSYGLYLLRMLDRANQKNIDTTIDPVFFRAPPQLAKRLSEKTNTQTIGFYLKMILPVVGSSKKSTVGERTSSMPMLVRFRSPPDMPRLFSVPTLESAHFSSPNCPMT